MTNFDFLKSDLRFAPFADAAITAEQLLYIDIDACVASCRRAMEFAVKWMYSVDRDLTPPYQDTLVALMNESSFKKLVGPDIWRRMDFIRKLGNAVMHGEGQATEEQAVLCLENLFYFLDEVAYFYADEYAGRRFDRGILKLTPEEALSFVPDRSVDLAALIEENRALKAELSARRAGQQLTYVPVPLEQSEYATRKLYIEIMLQDAGWVEGKDWKCDVKLAGPAGDSDGAVADCVLYGDDGVPLAVLESKLTCTDVPKGRQQANNCADLIEEKYGRRPVIFLSNGFDTLIQDGLYPERAVASVYTKRDLEKLFDCRPKIKHAKS